jgi:hypothetical protein
MKKRPYGNDGEFSSLPRYMRGNGNIDKQPLNVDDKNENENEEDWDDMSPDPDDDDIEELMAERDEMLYSGIMQVIQCCSKDLGVTIPEIVYVLEYIKVHALNIVIRKTES